MSSATKFRWLILAVGCALAAAGGVWLVSRNWSEQPAVVSSDFKNPSGLPASPVSRPAPPPEGFVGSVACASCHDEICKSFAQHPMGRSSALTPGDADLEDFSAEKSSFKAADGTLYRVEKGGGRVLHHELGIDAQGRIRYDQMVAMSLAIGSGTRGKTYAANHGGILLQSPISWYSAKGGYFELSPGYEQAATNPRFGRRMIEGCLVCHVGRMEFAPDIPDKLAAPYFHEITIGCERCHGPGEKHIAAQKAGKIPTPDSTIVNPARLPMRERDSVCYQCHLHGLYRGVRYGRHERDFRPGMALEEIFCVLVEDSKSSGESKAVSQVEQMRESVCFRESQGKLGCISCHDPHQWPKPSEQAAYYRSRCNDCHAEQGCSLPVDERAKQADSCIACHMPRTTPKDVVHASQTDHRVLKKPAAIADPAPYSGKAAQVQPKFFDSADSRLPKWEVMRARGMYLVYGAGEASGGQSDEALALLLPLPVDAIDDVPLLRAIGVRYLVRKDFATAREWLERAVAAEPQDEQALASLALACVGVQDYSAAKEHIAAVVKINPYVARNFALQAEILEGNKEPKLALQAAEKALELDPTQTSLRDRLLRGGGN